MPQFLIHWDWCLDLVLGGRRGTSTSLTHTCSESTPEGVSSPSSLVRLHTSPVPMEETGKKRSQSSHVSLFHTSNCGHTETTTKTTLSLYPTILQNLCYLGGCVARCLSDTHCPPTAKSMCVTKRIKQGYIRLYLSHPVVEVGGSRTMFLPRLTSHLLP